MRTVSVLGSTGSIGTQTLSVARWRGYRVGVLAAGRNTDLLLRQVQEFRPHTVAVDDAAAAGIAGKLPAATRLLTGAAGLAEAATLEADTVVAAVPGMAGLPPVRAALEAGRHVALAGKEAMVVAAPLIRRLLDGGSGSLTPVDSEHSGLFQCLQGEDSADVHSVVITASGGPFLRGPADLSTVTREQALRHPNWEMGQKISIDSATLFNKGLEVLEAQGLFGFPLDRIGVLVHPQQVVHGFVRFKDGSIKAQLGPHDMRLPIQYGIEWPARPAVPLEPLPLAGTWEFLEPDTDRFPALALAYEAGRLGGHAPAWLNAADEVAVAAFLEGSIPFTAIPAVLERTLRQAPPGAPDWDALYASDSEARVLAREQVRTLRAIL